MKLPSLLIATCAATLTVRAVVVTEPTRTFTVGYDLDDIVNPGAVFHETITDSAIVSLTDVRVGLHLIGRGVGRVRRGNVRVAEPGPERDQRAP